MTHDDQAKLLRELAASAQQNHSDQPATTALPALAITGGKGGIGKTCVSVNLSILLAKMGMQPLLVDCDLGLANADVMLGHSPKHTLYDVLMEGVPLEQAIIHDKRGVGLLPAASGREELTRLSNQDMKKFLHGLRSSVDLGFDLLMLDTAAGIQREVIDCLVVSKIVVVVVTPEPTAIADAYALVKVVEQQAPGKDLRVLVNMARHNNEAQQCFNRLRKVAQNYLGRDLDYLGMVPTDRCVQEAVRQRKPFVSDASSLATQALKGAAVRLKGEHWH